MTYRTALTVADRHDRYEAAKVEAKMLKAWEHAGSRGPRPLTPNLDELEAQYQHGGASNVKTITDPNDAPVAPPPVTRQQTLVDLGTERRGDIIAGYSAGLVEVHGRYAVVLNSMIEDVVTRMLATAKGLPIYDRRVVDYFTGTLLVQRRSITDDRNTTHAQLIRAARDGLREGRLTAFEFNMKPDGTLTVTATAADGTVNHYPTQRAALADLGQVA